MSVSAANQRVSYIDPAVLQRLLKASDFTVLFFGAVWLFFMSSHMTGEHAAAAGFLAIIVGLTGILSMRLMGLYETRALVNPIRGTLLAASAVALTGTAGAVFAHVLLFPVTFAWFTGWLILTLAHLGLTRGVCAAWARPLAQAGAFRRRIAIVGGGQAAEDAIRLLESSKGLDVEIVGLFDDRYDNRSPASVRRYRKIGKIADLEAYTRKNRVDLVIVAIPLSAEARLLQMLKRLWELPIDIRISGQASKLKLSPNSYRYLGDLPLLSVFERPLTGWGLVLKTMMDKVLAAVFIAILSPVMLAAAIAIRIDSPGPIIFRQRRYGFNNELVEVFKFRSMYTDMSDVNASKLVTKDDPRVTRVGRFIRKTSIDEMPQLFNALTGQLSLVGPRPHATQAKAEDKLYETVVDGYFARHKVKPGITGWAQINGWRGETDTRDKIENRVKYDLEYIDRWSLWFDLYIIAKTPFALLKRDNADAAY